MSTEDRILRVLKAEGYPITEDVTEAVNELLDICEDVLEAAEESEESDLTNDDEGHDNY